jgi:hypothetical protein
MDSTTGKQALPVALNRVKYGHWHGDCKLFVPTGWQQQAISWGCDLRYRPKTRLLGWLYRSPPRMRMKMCPTQNAKNFKNY